MHQQLLLLHFLFIQGAADETESLFVSRILHGYLDARFATHTQCRILTMEFYLLSRYTLQITLEFVEYNPGKMSACTENYLVSRFCLCKHPGGTQENTGINQQV